MSSSPDDISKWQVIYPNYINSKKKKSEGRRIGKEKCCENPNLSEMKEICDHFNIPCVLQKDKGYPRDFLTPGRIKVQIKKEDGSLANNDIPNKYQLQIKMGTMIPKLKSRNVQPSNNTNSKKKKKGKKRR
eukprot:TRINITY_DN100_c14_g1_i1.p1 TRINITY_DN100_c14_g1~~TRINITY_DN100_c14_g1_i1.p1  ORF type:complete len:131 (+),score=42.39 TRINITY_DN100_c14_g1_i1:144-536(+)